MGILVLIRRGVYLVNRRPAALSHIHELPHAKLSHTHHTVHDIDRTYAQNYTSYLHCWTRYVTNAEMNAWDERESDMFNTRYYMPNILRQVLDLGKDRLRPSSFILRLVLDFGEARLGSHPTISTGSRWGQTRTIVVHPTPNTGPQWGQAGTIVVHPTPSTGPQWGQAGTIVVHPTPSTGPQWGQAGTIVVP